MLTAAALIKNTKAKTNPIDTARGTRDGICFSAKAINGEIK
jgi:hypothetical protein